MFYLNTIEQLLLFVKQLDQLEVCLPYSRLLTGIPKLVVFQNLRWISNKTSLTNNKFKFKFREVTDEELDKIIEESSLTNTDKFAMLVGIYI